MPTTKTPKARTYHLLCPIARALDRIGDRWGLLVLRDLHAGPARFSDLQTGLPGLASNLLTTRLRQLQEAGLVRRRAVEFGATAYELTEAGEDTEDVLFALARFGTRFPADPDVRRPGNLRVVAVTLRAALQAVVDPAHDWRVNLVVDGEAFAIGAESGRVSVRYGAGAEPQAVIESNYEAVVGMADGSVPLARFTSENVLLREGDRRIAAYFLSLLTRAFGAQP